MDCGGEVTWRVLGARSARTTGLPVAYRPECEAVVRPTDTGPSARWSDTRHRAAVTGAAPLSCIDACHPIVARSVN